MGPSGSGKDSVLKHLLQNSQNDPSAKPSFYLSRRTIDRPHQAFDHEHESVSTTEFIALRSQGAFIMNWQANGFNYGIRYQELIPTIDVDFVLINGSRAYLSHSLHIKPELKTILVTASIDLLKKRLIARNREPINQIEDRLNRFAATPQLSADLVIFNESTLEHAAKNLRDWATTII